MQVKELFESHSSPTIRVAQTVVDKNLTRLTESQPRSPLVTRRTLRANAAHPSARSQGPAAQRRMTAESTCVRQELSCPLSPLHEFDWLFAVAKNREQRLRKADHQLQRERSGHAWPLERFCSVTLQSLAMRLKIWSERLDDIARVRHKWEKNSTHLAEPPSPRAVTSNRYHRRPSHRFVVPE